MDIISGTDQSYAMKKLILIGFILQSTSCFAQRKFYVGATVSSMKMTVLTHDTGNEMYPMTYWPSGPNYYGIQAGYQVSPSFILETGLQVVNYDETVQFKHHFYGYSNGMVAINVPVTGIWNFYSHSLAELSIVRYGLLAGVNIQGVNGRDSGGSSKMGFDDPNSFQVLTRHRSDEGPAYFLRPFVGIRSEIVVRNRFGFFANYNFVRGRRKVFINHVEYSNRGVKNTGSVAFTGGGRMIQFGFRYYFGEKVSSRKK